MKNQAQLFLLILLSLITIASTHTYLKNKIVFETTEKVGSVHASFNCESNTCPASKCNDKTYLVISNIYKHTTTYYLGRIEVAYSYRDVNCISCSQNCELETA